MDNEVEVAVEGAGYESIPSELSEIELPRSFTDDQDNKRHDMCALVTTLMV